MDLEQIRARLSDVDRQIIELIAERQNIVGEVSQWKLGAGRATRDFEREKIVIDRAREQAQNNALDPQLAEQLMQMLIESSLARQEQARVVAEGQGNGRRVLVIGGAGKMGAWFCDFFASQGYIVTIADPAFAGNKYPGFATWQEAGSDFDIIVVAATLAVSASVLEELAAAKPSGLVFDVGSLKSPLKKGLQALQSAGCQVTSVHPMFGPDTDLLSGRHVIFVDVGCPQATAQARELFAATMAETQEMDIEDHDRLIAYVLGLSHALNIAFFTALAESGEAAPMLAKMSSTTFDAQLAVAGNVAAENPGLYFEIQRLNEFGMAPLEALCNATERLKASVSSGDESGFRKLMDQGREYFAQRR